MEPLCATSVGLILLIILSKRASSLEAPGEPPGEALDVRDGETWVLPPAPDGGELPPHDTAPPPLNAPEPPRAAFGEAAREEPPDEYVTEPRAGVPPPRPGVVTTPEPTGAGDGRRALACDGDDGGMSSGPCTLVRERDGVTYEIAPPDAIGPIAE